MADAEGGRPVAAAGATPRAWAPDRATGRVVLIAMALAATLVALPLRAEKTGAAPSDAPGVATVPAQASAPTPTPTVPVIDLPPVAATPAAPPPLDAGGSGDTDRPGVTTLASRTRRPPRIVPTPTPTPPSATKAPSPPADAGVDPAQDAAVDEPIPTYVAPEEDAGVLGSSATAIAAIALAALLAGVTGWWFVRQRRGAAAPRLPAPVAEPQVAPPPVASVAPTMLDRAPPPAAPPAQTAPPPAAAPSSPRGPRLELHYRPTRLGLNLLSATVEGEVEVVNIGVEDACAIRVAARLFGVHRDGDVELAAFRAAPIDRTLVPAFALAPGERRRLRAVAALPRDAIRAVEAAGRPMFVPLVAVNIVYDGGEHQVAAAWAVGIERVDAARLAPLWLDTPPRYHDAVAARPHGAVFMR